MTATADAIFWAYNWYLANNPHKSNLTRQDIIETAKKFANANSTELSATDPGSAYSNVEWPDINGGASSISAVGNSSTDPASIVRSDLVDPTSQVTLDQAAWPEDHRT